VTSDPSDWSVDQEAGSIAMPGEVLELHSSQIDGQLWALVERQRAWWQIWRPRTWREWQSVVLEKSR